MRFIVDITYTEGDGIEGQVSWTGCAEPVSFSGWLELTRLLEARRHGQRPDRRTNPRKE